jgi:D-alanyl-lipoteichoic acid acyltransferase DltB (MBOAT superfamily)
MLISGMWHGTGWNFILWGLYHAVLLIIYRLGAMISLPKKISQFSNSNPGFLLKLGLMFFFISLGWVFFRAETVQQAFEMLASISLARSDQSELFIRDILFYSSPLLLMQFWQAIKGDLLVVTKQRFSLQLLVHSLLLIWIVIFGARQTTEFIYTI